MNTDSPQPTIKKKWPIVALIFTTLVLSYLVFFFYFSEEEDSSQTAKESAINQDIIIFEDIFFDFLNERFDQTYEDYKDGIPEKVLSTITKEAIEKIDEFQQETKVKNQEEVERIEQLRYYTYASIAKDIKKTQQVLDKFEPGSKKFSLLKDFIQSFAPLQTEDQMTKYLIQQTWAIEYDENYIEQIPEYLFFASPIGKIIPDHFKDFASLKGEINSSSSLKGKYYLVDFWATWCTPCLAELPYLIEAYNLYGKKGRKFPNKFEILSISLDSNFETLKNFIEERKLSWPQYYDGKVYDSNLVRKYQVNRIPTLYLVDPNGVVIDVNLNGRQLLNTLAESIKG